MNRRLPIIAGILLLVVAVIIGVSTLGGNGGSGKGDDDSKRSARDSRSARERVVRPMPTTPADAARQLRALLAAQSNQGFSFRNLETMAGKLDADDLDELIRNMEFEHALGAEGWVRSALYAEWGRRDPAAAMAYLAGFPLPQGGNEAIEQAWFSLFRGWAELHAMQAYDALHQLDKEAGPIGPTAYRKAASAIIRELARQEVGTAWDLVNSQFGLLDADIMAGFFAGLRDSTETESYLQQWVAAQWDTDEAREAHAEWDRQRSRSASGDVEPPPEENIVKRVAAAWADRDLAGAVAWLEENGPGNLAHRKWRAAQVAREWGQHHPGAALTALGDERFTDLRIYLGHGAIVGNPALAPQVMENLGDHAARVSTMMTALTEINVVQDDEWFPAPGNTAPLLTNEERYRYMLDAIELAKFPQRNEMEFRATLQARFPDVDPDALDDRAR